MHEYAGYWRKSVGRKGIAQQRKITTAHVERDGGRIVFERDDKDRTAYRGIGDERPPRPGFAEILAQLRGRPGLRLAAWHVDRITRDLEDAQDIIKTGCTVVTASGGGYDLSTATGRKQFIADVNDAQYEVGHNIERILARKDEHASEGRWMGGPAPFGWHAVPREDPDEPALLELDDREAALLRAAKDDVLSGRAVYAVARQWNAAGWRTRRGNPWKVTTLRAVLLRPRNAGLHQHRGQVRPGAQWAPLWQEPEQAALAAILTDPARRTAPGNGRRYLLSGIALCGECGTEVKIHISAHVPYYACARSAAHPMRRAERVDELVVELALRRLDQPDAAALLRADTSAGRAALGRRRATVEALMTSRAALHGDGMLTDTEFVAGRRKHLAELEEIKAALAELDRGDVLAPFIASPRTAWASAGLGGRRAVIGALMAVTLFPGRQGRAPDGAYFDYESVDVHWLRSLPSDG